MDVQELDEPLPRVFVLGVLVLGHEVAPRTQTDDSHSAIINIGRTRWQVGSPRGRRPDRSAHASSAPFTMISDWGTVGLPCQPSFPTGSALRCARDRSEAL